MPDIPALLGTSAIDLPHAPRLQRAWITAVDKKPNEDAPWEVSGTSNTPIALQYWPESLTDSRTVEWSPRIVPGGSHPIYQWTHSGERRLSFVTVFSTDTEPSEEALVDGDPYEDVELLTGIERGTRDFDIRAAISWLRWFTYPTYDSGEGINVYEPAKILLCMPNTGLGHTGEDHITCVMTSCEVIYEAWFTNGFPRIAEVSIEVAEVVQGGNGVRFHDRANMNPSRLMSSYSSRRDR